MNKTAIKHLALDIGFKTRPQLDGSDDLNPYVYEFARQVRHVDEEYMLMEGLYEAVREMKRYAKHDQDRYRHHQDTAFELLDLIREHHKQDQEAATADIQLN